VAIDVISRLRFLFEVKPSFNYSHEVVRPISLRFESIPEAGLAQLQYADNLSASSPPKPDDLQSLKKWALFSSENPKDLKRTDSSVLQAIFVFAKCFKLSNLTHLRNLMLD